MDRVASSYDNGQPATWEEAGTGKIYSIDNNPHSSRYGKKTYLSPRAVNPYDDSANANGPYKPGLLGGGSQWNSDTGQWDKKSNTLEKIVLGAAAAPFAAAGIGAFLGQGANAAMPALSAPSSVLPAGGTGIISGSGATAATTGAAASGGAAASAAPLASHAAFTGLPYAGQAIPGAVSGGSSAMLGGFLKGLMPTGGDILKGVGGYLSGRSQSKSDAQARADALLMNQQRREDEMRKSIADFLTGQEKQRLDATQMDPYAQAKSLNGANVRRSFAQGWSPEKGFSGSFDMSALDPSNLANENAKFQSAANDTGSQQKIMDYLNGMGGPNTKVCYDPKNGSQIPCPPPLAGAGPAQSGVNR